MALPTPRDRQASPRTLVVAGGKPGVGATTLAVNVAAALAADAQRVVLIDADLYRADAAPLCGVSPGPSIADVLSGRKTIHEALLRGPAGMQILAGSPSAEARAGLGDRTLSRLMRQLRSLAPHADWLVADAGNQPSEIALRLWSLAERVLLVTTPDAVAVMDTYSLIKTLAARPAPAGPLELIVNQVQAEGEASDVHRRIDQSCLRFLGLSVGLAGELPLDSEAAAAGRQGGPLVLMDERPLALALGRLARRIAELHQATSQGLRRAA